MPVMRVRHVGMIVLERLVPVLVRVRLPWRVRGRMGVLMMLVVHVAMVVGHGLVGVRMGVALPQKEAEADRHQSHGCELTKPEALAEKCDADEHANERADSKQGSLASHTDQAHRVHGEDDARPVAERAEQQTPSNRAGRRP